MEKGTGVCCGGEIVKSVYLTPVLRLEVSAAVYKDRGSLYNGEEERAERTIDEKAKREKKEREICWVCSTNTSGFYARSVYTTIPFSTLDLTTTSRESRQRFLSAFLRVIHPL